MNRQGTCLNFKAKKVSIDAHVGDDIRFSVIVKLQKVDVPADVYDVETFIYSEDEEDVSDTYNFTFEKFDGLINFSIDDAMTTAMGPGRWIFAIVVTLLSESDYERSYVNGPLVLTERSNIE